MNRPRVLLADDHVVLLEGLKGLIVSDFNVVGAVEDGRALVEAAKELQPDAIVADISMPLLNGIEAAGRIRKSCPKTRIVFLTMHQDAGLLKQAMRAGASGYVLKRSAVQELKTALREALGGRLYISPEIVEVLGVPPPMFLEQGRRAKDDLTQRQLDVLQLLAEGKSIKQIAAILGIAVKTAEFHKYRIQEKLGIRTSAGLIRYAIQRGILPVA